MNDLSFSDASALLNEIVSQATGKTPLAATTPEEFVSVAQTALLTGYDPMLKAISQVLSRTIFSIRPYTRKFGGLQVNEIQYGNHVRKINYVDQEWSKSQPYFEALDGQSVDMYKINAPEVIQTNFYGQAPYQRHITRYETQLRNALSGWQEFAQFWAGVLSNISDQIEQAHESCARLTLSNLTTGTTLSRPDNVYHLLTEYNTLTGQSLTQQTIYLPDNYEAFIRWLYGRINTLSDLLTERSVNYHTNITGKPISRHTPKSMQHFYLSASIFNNIRSNVLSTTFHDEMMQLGDFELVNYWQSISSPLAIMATPTYLATDGSLTTPEDPVAINNVLGVIFDRDAAGYTVVDRESGVTPYNVAGRYWNYFFHFNDRYWNDFTENTIVLMLD